MSLDDDVTRAEDDLAAARREAEEAMAEGKLDAARARQLEAKLEAARKAVDVAKARRRALRDAG